MVQQRFITGIEVFDTYAGKSGSIVQMNLMDTLPITNPITPLYTDRYFIVKYTDATLQLFTWEGKLVDHVTGVPTLGITLLTQKEYAAAVSAGYPKP